MTAIIIIIIVIKTESPRLLGFALCASTSGPAA
jgi:hypothetical protein